MNISKLFEFWGVSDSNIILKDFIIKNKFNSPENEIIYKVYHNSKFTVTLGFKYLNSFENYFYKPIKTYTDSDDEAFLVNIEIGDFYGNPNFPFELPFNLTFNDNYSEVTKKLNTRSSKASNTAAESVYYQFNFDDFYVLTYFNKNDKLIFLSIQLFETSVLNKIKLEKSFKLQNKNLKTENITLLEELKIQKPTFEWKQRMLEGDNIFNDENITETSKELDVFIDNLKDAVLKRNSKNIYNATKKSVKLLNKLNERFDDFIETTEREELCEFIDKCIRITGFEIEKDFDITQEWREW